MAVMIVVMVVMVVIVVGLPAGRQVVGCRPQKLNISATLISIRLLALM